MRLILYFVLIALVSFTSISYSQDTLCNSLSIEKTSIKVLSWNIYMLPRFIKNTGKLERAEKIGKEILDRDYDVIVFQEAFHSGARKIIKKELSKQYKYSAGPANKKTVCLRTNSGIWIFSKYPIINSQSLIFHNKFGIDALSRKGALIVEINVNGKKIQIVGTHLQSSGSEWIKHSQCVELTERLIRPFEKKGVPQIICGDFNIDMASTYHYQKMLQTLGASDSELSGNKKHTYDRLNNDLHDEPKSVKQDLIDYILHKANDAVLKIIQKRIEIFHSKWDKSHKDLSDHYPLSAEIEFDNTITLTELYIH
jgi:sphingomyelin phosphodiesterase